MAILRWRLSYQHPFARSNNNNACHRNSLLKGINLTVERSKRFQLTAVVPLCHKILLGFDHSASIHLRWTPVPPSGSYKIFAFPVTTCPCQRTTAHHAIDMNVTIGNQFGPSANVACNNQITLWSINTLTGTHGYLLNAFCDRRCILRWSLRCGSWTRRFFLSFRQDRQPHFSISALSCASLQPLTPITRKPVAETALCIADQFTGLPVH